MKTTMVTRRAWFAAYGLKLILMITLACEAASAQPLESSNSDTLTILALDGVTILGQSSVAEDPQSLVESQIGIHVTLHVAFPGFPAGVTTAYLVEPPMCPPTCPPELDPSRMGAVSDIVTLTIGAFVAIPPVGGNQDFDFVLKSEPNDNLTIPPGTPSPGTPGSPVFVEDGKDQPITDALIPAAAPFIVTVKSCSVPCQVPEPPVGLLLATGFAGLLNRRVFGKLTAKQGKALAESHQS